MDATEAVHVPSTDARRTPCCLGRQPLPYAPHVLEGLREIHITHKLASYLGKPSLPFHRPRKLARLSSDVFRAAPRAYSIMLFLIPESRPGFGKVVGVLSQERTWPRGGFAPTPASRCVGDIGRLHICKGI